MAKSNRNKHEEQLFLRLQEPVRGKGCELIDLRFKTENKKRFLRLYIDKMGGVTIDDCERVSRCCDALLDEWGEDKHDYFEVQSPGLDRALVSPIEFILHKGEDLDISLYRKKDGMKKFTAKLIEADEEGICVRPLEGEVIELSYDELAQVKRVIHFK